MFPRLIVWSTFLTKKDRVSCVSNNYQEWEDDDFDMEDDTPQPRQAESNDLVRQLRKAQRIAEKRAKELEGELQTLRTAQRDTVIKSVLESKGLNPKVARFVPADLEPTEDALSQWVTEYADVFGLTSSQEVGQASPDLATLRQIDSVTQGAVTPDKIENLLLRLDQAGSADEIINMIHGSN